MTAVAPEGFVIGGEIPSKVPQSCVDYGLFPMAWKRLAIVKNRLLPYIRFASPVVEYSSGSDGFCIFPSHQDICFQGAMKQSVFGNAEVNFRHPKNLATRLVPGTN